MSLEFDEHVMMIALKGWLKAQFEAEPEAAPSAGANATLKRQERPKMPDLTPSILLSLQNDRRSRWAGANGSMRDCLINIECRASPNAGAIETVEQPEAAHIQLARTLRDWFKNRLDSLDQIGITMPQIETLSEDGTTVKMRLGFTYNEE